MKKWLKIAAGLVLGAAVILVGVSGYFGYSLTRVQRVPLSVDPAQHGLDYEDVSFTSTDGKLTLRGWLIPGASPHKMIIMVHGNGANRADADRLEMAAQLVSHGYSVLMFDLRGCGESDGNMVSGGYYEKRDLEGAVRFVEDRGFSSVGVLGYSLGATTSLLAAAEDEDIAAVVADSGFADLADIMVGQYRSRTSAPVFLLRPILFMIKIMYGVDFTAVRPVACVPEIAPRPILFIHGEDDDLIPAEQARRLFAASQNPRDQLWIVPGAGHTGSFAAEPDEYAARVTAFFDAALSQ